jgi:predicted transcriptional regulator
MVLDCRLGDAESKFAELIWANEPLSSSELVRLSKETMNWKKSTTYTVLKRLCAKGIFINEQATVRSRVSREDFYACQSRRFVEDTFGGSLPAFVASFITGRPLSEKQADDLVRLINRHREENQNG